jgi:hypothetical protein
MLYPGTLLKSPDGHDGNGVGLAVVEEVEGEDVVEWVHSYYGMGLGQHFQGDERWCRTGYQVSRFLARSQ